MNKELGTITRSAADALLVTLQTAATLGHRISVVVEQGVDIISFVVEDPQTSEAVAPTERITQSDRRKSALQSRADRKTAPRKRARK